MNNDTKKSNTALRALLASLGGLVVLFAVLVRATFATDARGEEVTLNQLYRLAGAGQILSATLLDQDAVVVGRFCPNAALAAPEAGQPDASSCPGSLRQFHTPYPRSDVVTQSLVDRVGAKAPVEVDPQAAKQVGRLLVTFVLPLLVLANLFALIFMARGTDGSMAEITGFGRFRRTKDRERASERAVTFADVAGAGHAVTELAEVIDYLKEPARFRAMGAAAPKGVLLFGPPGCGKTLLARAVAGESGVPFVSVSGTEFVESLVGVGAARVRDLFAQVRALAPAICFVDEIDALGRKREGEGVSGGEREQTLNQLLVEMDGFDAATGVVVIAATNRPDILDAALMRPGRFDRHITLEPPDAAGRRAILAVHARNRPLAPGVDLDSVAVATPGFTGADLANVLNEAALLTVRANETTIGSAHISEAISRVLHGPHRGTLLSAPERTRIATHEAAHAVVATALGLGSEVHRVSVVARGRALGTTALGGDDKALHTTADLEARLTMALAGTAAEDAILGSVSTTAEDDVERATAVARQMVGLYGMSAAVGRVRILSRSSNYLGDDGVSFEAVSARTVEAFDAEVRRLIDTAEARAKAILSDNRAQVETLVNRLEADETLEGATLGQLLATVVPAPPAVTNGSATRKRARVATAKDRPGEGG
jgi:cell division protease FtsH